MCCKTKQPTKNWETAVTGNGSRTGFTVNNVYVFGWRCGEGMCSTYLMPATCPRWFCCLARQLFGSRSKKKDLDGAPDPAGLRGAPGEMCWALIQRGPHPQWRGPPRQVLAEYRGRNEQRLFEEGLQMFLSAGKRGPLWHLFFCALVCAFPTAVHPSLASPVRTGAIKSHCFYSISCHYRRQFDYWVHLAAGEQWRQQAAFLFTLPPILSTPAGEN